MYRIDENTYIDESLITCAEYQLFIDEMLMQGKYVQPYHWVSYQFPSGHGRHPILGVYASDAEAFCNWLSLSDTGEWHYRLPVSVEAKQFPIKDSSKTPVGYWIIGEEGKFQFTWIGNEPLDAKILESTEGKSDENRSLENKRRDIRSYVFEGIRIVKERVR